MPETTVKTSSSRDAWPPSRCEECGCGFDLHLGTCSKCVDLDLAMKWEVHPVPPEIHADPDVLIGEDALFWITEHRKFNDGEVIALIERNSQRNEKVVACLMAAAPDLLRAVELAQEFFINPHKFNPLDVERAYQAAIRKAKEGQ